MSIDLGNKTVKFNAQREPVPLERISDRSAVIIDSLSRLCRERRDNSISDEEYSARFDRVVAPFTATKNTTASYLPVYRGAIDTRGYSGNKKLIDFLNANEGKVVRIVGEIDRSWHPGFDNNENACQTEDDLKNDGIWKKGGTWALGNVYNTPLPIPLLPITESWEFPDGSSTHCDSFMIHFKGDDEPVYTSGGVGVILYKVDSFFRIILSSIGSSDTYYLTEVPASAGDFAG